LKSTKAGFNFLRPGFLNSLGQISHALYEVGGEYRRNM